MVKIKSFVIRVPYKVRNIKKTALSHTHQSRYEYNVVQRARMIVLNGVMHANNLEDFKYKIKMSLK